MKTKFLNLAMALFAILMFQSCQKDELPQNVEKSSTQNEKRSMGYIPSTPEQLAQIKSIKSSSQFSKITALPSKILFPELPTALNQGFKGSCIAYAIADACTLMNNETKTLADGKPNYNAYASGDYLYEKCRISKNSCQGGIYYIDALDVLKTEGTTTYSDMGLTLCGTLPTKSQQNNAKKFRINDYYRLTSDTGKPTLEDIKRQLANGNPVIISIAIDNDFTSSSIKLWDINNSVYAGGHAVVLTGYDNEKQAFRLLNSWGSNWGENGYLWATYRKIEQAINEEVYVLVKDSPLTLTKNVSGTAVTFIKDLKKRADNVGFYPTQQTFTNQMVPFMNDGELNWNNNVIQPLYQQNNNPMLSLGYWTSNDGFDISGDYTFEVRVRLESSKSTSYPTNTTKGVMLELWNGGYGGSKSKTIDCFMPITGSDAWTYFNNDLGETYKWRSNYIFGNYNGNLPLSNDVTIRFRLKDGQFVVNNISPSPKLPSGINRLYTFNINFVGVIATVSDVRIYRGNKQIGIDTFDDRAPKMQWYE